MSSIIIHDWKEVKNEGNDFTFMPPEYHPVYWEVPRWWYMADEQVYTSCARVDFTRGYKIFIDGTTPLMHLKITWDGRNMKLTDEVDIRRILVCKDPNAVALGETTEYMDIRYNKYYPRFEIAFDGLNGDIDVPIDSPIVFTKNPSWKSGNTYEEGETVVALTGVWIGGDPPVVSRARFQTKAPGDTTWTDQPWFENVDENEEYSFVIQPGTEFIRFEQQVEETEKARSTSEFTPIKGIGGAVPPPACTPLYLLPDLGSPGISQRVCVDGEQLKLEEQPELV